MYLCSKYNYNWVLIECLNITCSYIFILGLLRPITAIIVGENIIDAPKMQNSCPFSQNYDSSNALCKVITLILLCIIFDISSLLLFLIALYKVIDLLTITITIVVAL